MDELTSLIMNPPHEREIFANRTLNMRAIRAIGYDMDYTLINYDVARWERAMYEYLKRRVLELGWWRISSMIQRWQYADSCWIENSATS